MGRSVSYPSDALVVTFSNSVMEVELDCSDCEGTGKWHEDGDEECAEGYEGPCESCNGTGTVTETGDADHFDFLIDDFRQHLRTLFPSVHSADDWIGREDHVLAENLHVRFGMSEYCGLVAYWIVPNEFYTQHGSEGLAKRWIKSIADKFVKAFGELSKVGSMSNGEGVYRRIDK